MQAIEKFISKIKEENIKMQNEIPLEYAIRSTLKANVTRTAKMAEDDLIKHLIEI